MQAEIKKIPGGYGIYVNGSMVDEADTMAEANKKLEALLGGPSFGSESFIAPPAPLAQIAKPSSYRSKNKR